MIIHIYIVFREDAGLIRVYMRTFDLVRVTVPYRRATSTPARNTTISDGSS